MTTAISARQLHEHTDELTARVATGERFGIARGGRLVTAPAPPAL
ncbi:hypothetical protein [Kitasatospora sp. NPDC056531]